MPASNSRCSLLTIISILALLFLTQAHAYEHDSTPKRLLKRWRSNLSVKRLDFSPPDDRGNNDSPGDRGDNRDSDSGGNRDGDEGNNNNGGDDNDNDNDGNGNSDLGTITRTKTVTVTPSDPVPPPSSANPQPSDPSVSEPPQASASDPPTSSEPSLGVPLPELSLSADLPILPTASPSPPVETFIPKPEAYLIAHNSVRAGVGAPAVEWSRELESSAREWVSLCIGRTSGGIFGQLGENMVAGSGLFTEADAVSAWVNEPYDPSNPVGSHYSQVVWKSTRRIGCASVSCPGLLNGRNARLHMCQYDPPGNILGFFGDNVVV